MEQVLWGLGGIAVGSAISVLIALALKRLIDKDLKD